VRHRVRATLVSFSAREPARFQVRCVLRSELSSAAACRPRPREHRLGLEPGHLPPRFRLARRTAVLRPARRPAPLPARRRRFFRLRSTDPASLPTSGEAANAISGWRDGARAGRGCACKVIPRH
jgi:hypothetical protein